MFVRDYMDIPLFAVDWYFCFKFGYKKNGLNKSVSEVFDYLFSQISKPVSWASLLT